MEKILPEGWEWRTLEEVTDILDNLRKPVSSDERAKRIGNVPYYGATGQAGWIDDYLFDEELILLGEDGAPFFDKTKNVAYLIKDKTWVNNHAHVLRGKANILENIILLHYLNQFNYTDFVGGTTRLKLTQGDLKRIPIPIPPLAEQQRIAARLDEMMEAVENAKKRIGQIPEKMKQFRQAVLAQAVSGSLTEDWRDENPDVESAEELLERINEFQEKTNKDFNKIFNDSTVEEPHIIPDNWEFVNLDKLCKGFKYGTSSKSDDNGDVPVLRMGNLQNGKIDWTDLKFTSEISEIKKYKLVHDDILFNRTNSPELVGKTSIFKGENEAIYAGYLIKIDLLKDFSISDYINITLNSLFAKKWCSEVKTDGVSQSNINAQKLAKYPIPLPPLAEQQEIVRRVESLFEYADGIEAKYAALKEKMEQLPQAILAKAFRGEI